MVLAKEYSSPGGASGEEPTYQCRRCKIHVFDSWVGKMPWRRAWQPPPVFLPGKSHSSRNLVSYGPWGHSESDTIERLSTLRVSTGALPLLAELESDPASATFTFLPPWDYSASLSVLIYRNHTVYSLWDLEIMSAKEALRVPDT